MRQPQSRNSLGRQPEAEQQEQPVGGDEARRRAHLRRAAVARAPARRRILDREQRRPAPFAAQPEALAEAQHAQSERRPPARLRIGRQERDQRRRQPHRQQAGDQRRLAPDPVAEMPEDRRAHRPREERDRQRGEARQSAATPGASLGEEQLAEHQARRGRVDVEVVELDRRADEAREQDAGVGIAHHASLAASRGRRNGLGRRRRFRTGNISRGQATHTGNPPTLTGSSPSFSPLLATAAGPFPFWSGIPELRGGPIRGRPDFSRGQVRPSDRTSARSNQ